MSYKKEIYPCMKNIIKMAKKAEVQSILIDGIGKTISSFLKNQKIDWKIMYDLSTEIMEMFDERST